MRNETPLKTKQLIYHQFIDAWKDSLWILTKLNFVYVKTPAKIGMLHKFHKFHKHWGPRGPVSVGGGVFVEYFPGP